MTACSVPGLRRCGSRLQNDPWPGWPGARELRRLAWPAGKCETAIQPEPWRPETTQGDGRPGRVKTKPVSRSPGHGGHLAPGSSCPGRSAWLTRMPGCMCRLVSQRAGAGGSMMSAACRSARAIRSRGLTLCSSSVSSETSSRNGVRSSTPGSPPVFATRPALAAWAVRRAWSARRPATRPLSRVPLATATSWPVPELTGVSGAAPGCISLAASACGSSDTTITSNSRSRLSGRRTAYLVTVNYPARRSSCAAPGDSPLPPVSRALDGARHRAAARADDPDRRPSWPDSACARPVNAETFSKAKEPSAISGAITGWAVRTYNVGWVRV